MNKNIVFFDTEVSMTDEKIHDIGAVCENGLTFHSPSISDFISFIGTESVLCGHNIIHHDLKYIEKAADPSISYPVIDTLYLSPLLFPKRPYHSLVKDDKLQTDELNNPVNDSKKAMALFYDELNAYHELPDELRTIYQALLSEKNEFKGFFAYIEDNLAMADTETMIRNFFLDKICICLQLFPVVFHALRILADIRFGACLIVHNLHGISPAFDQVDNPLEDKIRKYQTDLLLRFPYITQRILSVMIITVVSL